MCTWYRSQGRYLNHITEWVAQQLQVGTSSWKKKSTNSMTWLWYKWFGDTYNSPLQIISHMARTCPCQQTARKIPATAKRANIFLQASGPAFCQRSMHVLTHCASLSISVMLSHGISSESRSASGRSSTVAGTGVALGTGRVDDSVGVVFFSTAYYIR